MLKFLSSLLRVKFALDPSIGEDPVAAAQRHVALCFDMADTDHDGLLSLEELRRWYLHYYHSAAVGSQRVVPSVVIASACVSSHSPLQASQVVDAAVDLPPYVSIDEIQQLTKLR